MTQAIAEAAMESVVTTMAARPWTSQREVAAATGLALDQLRQLNAVIRRSDTAQDRILRHGPGYKYWATLLPLFDCGALKAAIERRYHWPARLGIYPGVSCMFHCTCCGRYEPASYDPAVVRDGNMRFESVFEAAPRQGTTFSFSGGLEPLTNPALGDLITRAAAHGIAVPLITNGFMLTEHYLRHHPGMWNLDRLRVSLYGVDEASYAVVTRRAGAFARVRENVVALLRARQAAHEHVRVGLNYIVLPGLAERILELPKLIGGINADAGVARGIDFLTLREDFCTTNPALSNEERSRLPELLQEFAALIERRCPSLSVDYGYALAAIARGQTGERLAMVKDDEIRPGAFTQVSAVMDLLGDVYLFREAGFLERPGATRYRIGRVTDSCSLEDVLRRNLAGGGAADVQPGDSAMLDAFDHVVTLVLNRMDRDIQDGMPLTEGPVALAAH